MKMKFGLFALGVTIGVISSIALVHFSLEKFTKDLILDFRPR